MVVDDLDVRRAGRGPAKADAVLIVDADAVLAGAIPLQVLQAIPRRHAQVTEPPGDHQLAQLASRHGGDVREAPGTATAGEGLRVGQRHEIGLERPPKTHVTGVFVHCAR